VIESVARFSDLTRRSEAELSVLEQHRELALRQAGARDKLLESVSVFAKSKAGYCFST
jgi:hypothetical protein